MSIDTRKSPVHSLYIYTHTSLLITKCFASLSLLAFSYNNVFILNTIKLV